MRPGRTRRLALATAALGSVLALTPAPTPSTARALTPRAGGPAAVTAAADPAYRAWGATGTTGQTGTTGLPTTEPAGSVDQGLSVALQDVDPVVVTDGEDVTVTATVRNTSSRSLGTVTVAVRQEVAAMTTRDHVQAWAESTAPADGGLLVSRTLPGPLAAGQATRVQLQVPSVGAGRAATYGSVGVSVDAVSGSASGRQHTFLGYQRIKQYEPLHLAVALPLVLDADSALSGTSSGREAAWARVTGSRSRLDRILAASRGRDVSWLLDPALVQPVEAAGTSNGTSGGASASASATTTTSTPTVTPTQVSPPTAVSSLGYAASAKEATERTAFADRVRAAAASHPTVLLPAGDPDLVAASAAGGPTADTVRSLVTDATIGLGGLTATTGVAWPAQGSWSPQVEADARDAYGSSLSAALVDSRWATSSDTTPSAERRSVDGLPLVVYDDPVSRLLDATTSRSAGSLATQQLVADTAALVTELPGTVRSVAAVASRTLDPDPGALSRLLGATGRIPWLTVSSLPTLVDQARDGSATGQLEQPQALPGTVRSPLTPRAAATAASDVESVRAMASVRADGARYSPPWEQAAVRLTATSWRSQRAGFATVARQLHAAASTDGLEVSPREVNFLADSGRVQITVVNNLAVDVHDVTLTLQPDNPRLRVDTPRVVLRIGARSRTTVSFEVTAYAAGLVPITTTLSAPDGTVIRSDAPVRIRVSPTGHWIYWALGVVAAALFVAGIWRGTRRGDRSRVADPDEDVAT